MSEPDVIVILVNFEFVPMVTATSCSDLIMFRNKTYKLSSSSLLHREYSSRMNRKEAGKITAYLGQFRLRFRKDGVKSNSNLEFPVNAFESDPLMSAQINDTKRPNY